MTELSAEQLAGMRANAKAMWSDGDYPSIAARLESASWELVDAAQVFAGDRVLDVGTGSGNTALALAQRGGEVTSIDQTDAWFDVARARAKDAAVEIEFIQADAEDLPLEDASFDVVVSCFAHIFAPRHDVVAAEMGRVLKPGGLLAVAVWDDVDEPAFESMRRWLPTPPEGVGQPRLWGDPEYLRARFKPAGIRITRSDVVELDWEFQSRDEMVDWLFTASGPWIATRRSLEAAGDWSKALAALKHAIDKHDVRQDGTVLHRMRYRIAMGTRT